MQHLLLLRRYDEAAPHLDALIAAEESAGWGHLLAGWVALCQGKADTGQKHFIVAQGECGLIPLVHMGMASAYVAVRQWEPALEHLQAVAQGFDKLSAEERGWASQYFGPGLEGVRFYQLYAELQRGRWAQAQPYWTALRGTRLEPKAVAVVVAHLWGDNPQRAYERLATARQHFPRDHGLLSLELAMLDQSGRTAEAQQRIEAFAAAAPANDLKSQLLLCNWRLGHDQAPRVWEDLPRLETQFAAQPLPQAVLAVLKAETLSALGKTAEALQLMEAFRTDPQVGLAASLLTAAAQARLDHPEKAAEALTAAQRRHPGHVLLNQWQGELAARTGDYPQALECLSASLEVTALRARAALLLEPVVRALAPHTPPADLAARVAQLLAKAPHEPPLLVAQAELQLRQGQVADAEKLMAEAARYRPRDPQVAALQAAAWWRANQVRHALAAAQRGLELDPRHLPCLLLAAQASLAAGQNQAAHDYAAAAATRDPQASAAQELQAEALGRLGRHQDAIPILLALARREPAVAQRYLALGQAVAAAGRVDVALEVYRRGAGQLPGNVSLLAAEVRLLAVAGRAAEARQRAELLAGPAPSPALCLALGQALDAGDQFAAAQAWFRRALAADEERQQADAHLALASCLLRQQRGAADRAVLAECRDHFAAVVRTEPKNLLAANNLAWLLATEFEQPAEALRVIDEARAGARLEQLPTPVIHTVAVAFRTAGRAADARRVLSDALAHRPDDTKLLLEFGTLLADSKRTEEARVPIQRALALGLPAPESDRARRLLDKLDSQDPAPAVLELPIRPHP